MSATEEHNLWLQLRSAGLVEGNPPVLGVTTAPWYVRVMLGVAGWIGALFLLLFVGVGLTFVVKSAGASFVLGLVASAAAGLLFRVQADNDFFAQFGLAVSLAGQGLVLWALGSWLPREQGQIALAMALFQSVLFCLLPNLVHRVWVAWTGAVAVVLALAHWHLQAYGPGLLSAACAGIWLNEFRYAKHGAILRACGYGLTLALMAAVALVTWMAGGGGNWLWHPGRAWPPGSKYHLWIGAGMGGAALLWTVRRLLMREAVQPASTEGWAMLGAAGVVALASLKAIGLAPATLMLLLGYGNGNRLLAGLGVTALLGYLSFYYHSLQATLLYKSVLISATGLALLAARFMLSQWRPMSPSEEGRHA